MSVVPIISVTGTKGKTTTVAVVADVLRKLEKNVLKVDTTGHFMNGERKSTLDESKAAWRLVPSVCPGRYLWEFHQYPNLKKDGVAVLECSLGCSGPSGLGYRYHNVGVFLNVFEDHIGSSDRIQSKEDIALAKQFVFSRLLHNNAYAAFNADDHLVVDSLKVLPAKTITKVPFGLSFSKFPIEQHLKKSGVAFTVNDAKQVVMRTVNGDTVMFDLKRIPWTFNASFEPSVWNLLAAVAAVYGYFSGNMPEGIRSVFESVRLDRYGGRLTLLKAENGATVLADYAHEKQSLAMVARLAREQIGEKGKVIGVVRLAHDRTDELMRDTGHVIATEYDEIIVYDKIDGYLRHAKRKGSRFTEVVGRTSEILTNSIAEINPHVERILREDLAIKRAAEKAKAGDIVVIIVNDDIHRSIEFIKENFNAEFI
jgi:cyanophycin synthetase